MRTTRLLVLACTLVYHLPSNGQQSSTCTNADFELNNFSNWIASTGGCCPVNTPTQGVVSGRHTIMSGTGFDPNSNGLIPLVPPGGGNFTARLGNEQPGAQAEQLSYTFPVTAATALFIYRYAVVLEDPSHSPSEQPRFSIRVFDQNNQPVSCGAYDVVASANIPGFISVGSLRIKPWTTIGIELSAYIGQSLTIEFTTADCGLGAHFGYAYMDCYCSPFMINSDYCPGSNTTQLNAPPGFASYLWSTGDTTETVSVSNPVVGTTYTVTMTSVTGCSVTLQTVLTPTNLQAAFYTTMRCMNETRFIDSSFVLSGTPVQQWLWNFGDGTTSAMQHPVHQYAAPGNYPVTLIVYNSNCSDTVTKWIHVFPAPEAGFAFVPQCPGISVPFTDGSFIASGSITSWEWNFGDGSPPGLLQHPGHVFPGIGPYNVVLTVTAANGCSDTVMQAVNPVLQPSALIAYTPDCDHTTVQFTASLAYSCGPVSKFKWDFGDGTADTTTLTPAHTYPATGMYTITLLLIAANQAQGTVTMQVIVPEKPVADFSVTSACLHEPNLFADLSTVAFGTITGREWTFGDGNTASTGPATQHTYALAGTYEAKLTVVSDFNCRDSSARQATVWELPVSGFAADVLEGCEPLEVGFTAQSVPGSGTISGYSWNFGNGLPDSLVNPVAVFPAGTFDVSLVTICSLGCRDTFTRPLYITAHPLPVPEFVFNPNPVSIFYPEAHFLCTTSGLQAWHWNFGDGSEAGGMQASHVYPGVGIYQVLLEVISEKGCPGSVIRPLEVVEEFTLYFPNAYTPNGDGINDLFAGIGTGIEDMELFVFDRWGKMVYKTNDYGSGWDGTVAGTHAGEGMFTYLAHVTDLNGIRHSRKGTFALIR